MRRICNFLNRFPWIARLCGADEDDAASSLSAEASIYTHEIVRRMFVATADQNYATARWAFLNEQYVDFFWLSLHAIEKYLKAILLMNGRGTRRHSHDIERLFRAVRNLDTRLSFGALVKPVRVDADFWRDEPLDDFIKRVNEMGDPSNRYMLYGYSLRPDDLFKVDQLVWAVRRYCRPFHTSKPDIDWITYLQSNPSGSVKATRLEPPLPVS